MGSSRSVVLGTLVLAHHSCGGVPGEGSVATCALMWPAELGEDLVPHPLWEACLD